MNANRAISLSIYFIFNIIQKYPSNRNIYTNKKESIYKNNLYLSK